jgi:1-acyl-sn-glycerol-3-phosphate acyltransferase
MNTVRGVLKLTIFALMCAVVVPVQGTVLLLTKGPMSYYIPRLWHDTARRVFGIRFEMRGMPSTGQQTLYMCNHLSYLDIPLIGSILKSSFVAKSEVSAWPLFGLLSKLQQTAFIQRRKSAIKKEKDSLQARIARGESLIIFPEGTSTDGQKVLPFKSSLFSLAMIENNHTLFVQPMTLQILSVDERPPENQHDRDLYAWHIDMDTPLHVHLWRFAKTRGATLRLTFHEPLRASDYADRKVLAKTCHDNVSKGLETVLAA